MAVGKRSWTKSLAMAALLVGAGASILAQQAPGVVLTGNLTGRLTDLYAKPLGSVTVVVRNQATGAEARTTTARNGAYQFNGLEPGEYTLAAESEQLGRGQVEGIVVSASHGSRVETAMQLEPLPPATLLSALQNVKRPDIQPSTPTVTVASLTAEPLHSLPLNLLALPKTAVPMPEARTPTLDAKLAAEPSLSLPLTGSDIQNSRAPAAPLQTPGPRDQVLSVATQPTAVSSIVTATGNHPAKPEPHPSPREIAKLPVAPANEELTSAAPSGAALPAQSPVKLIAGGGACGIGGSAVRAAGSAIGGEAGITGHGLSLTEAAARAVRAAVEYAQPRQPHVLAASQDAGPLENAVASKVEAAELQSLPVSGRRWQDFVFDSAPASAASADGQTQTSLRGAGSQPAELSVDGATPGLAFGRTGSSNSSVGGASDPAGMARPWAGGRGFTLSEAAIRQVRIAAGNVEAQSARGAGGRVNVETRRGANGFHGQGFLFDRQNTWGARNPFSQWVKETAPATLTTTPVFTPEPYTPSDHELTWGIGMGRHIRRNKLFWFAALDGYQRNDPAVSTVKHPDKFFAQPSNDQMQVLSARLGMSSANPVAEGISAYSKLLETLGGLLGPAPRSATQWTGFTRLDWEASERNRFTLEGTGATWNAPGGGLTRVSETYGNHSLGSSQASQEWILGRWEAFLTQNVLAVTQASAGRTIQGARPDTPSAFEQSFSGNVWNQVPQIVVDSGYGFIIGNPSRFGPGSYPDEHLYQGQETLDWVHGNLQFKAGFDLRHNADATSLLRNRGGTYYYSSLENFASDALVFGAFGLSGSLDPFNQRNCDQTGKVWRDTAGGLHGLGNLPCYSYYSQTIGPSDWQFSTNDWAGFASAQWQPHKQFVVSAGLRWEREQLPPPLKALSNPALPLTQKLPSLGGNWSPRLSLAWGTGESHWPVLRLGYGIYFGRVQNATIESALTQTGSFNGDLNFFLRPTDNLNAGGAPPFPYVLAGPPSNTVKPGAVEFASNFRNLQAHQAVAAIEETLPGHFALTASAMASLGRRLPITLDTNFDPAVNPGSITYEVVDGTGKGPIKATEITVPFYASWPSAHSATGFAGRLNPDYQQISEIFSRANSTYEAAMVRISRYGRRGLTFHANYTYAHAMDWNPNESAQVAGNDVLDPADFSLEYGTSNLDVRHSASVTVVWEAPWKLRNLAGHLANGWMLSGVGHFRSGTPYTMHTAGSLPKEFMVPSGAAVVGLAPGMNGSGGDNRVYGVGNDNRVYNIGRNTFRYPATWKADLRLAKRFNLGQMRQLELLAESFNLFNHQNVTGLETVGYSIGPGSTNGAKPTLSFLTGLKANTTAFGQPLNINATNFYRERQIQVGVRLRF